MIRGQRCIDTPRMMGEWAAALQFPYYFGHNWDALSECLSDLEWLFVPWYAFFITHADRLLVGQDDEFRILMRILFEAQATWSTPIPETSEWARPAVAFHVVFHAEPPRAAATFHRLQTSGLTPSWIDLST